MTSTRSIPKTAAWLLVAAAAVTIVGAQPAQAHASLRTTTPVDGQTVATPPSEVTLQFNEDVQAPTAGIRVFDGAGNRVDSGQPVVAGTDMIGVALEPGLSDDTYVVTWRATSADGHLVRGAFVFSVGAAGSVDEALVARLFQGDGDALFEGLAWLLRVLTYLGVLLAVGAVAWGVLVRAGEPVAERLVRHGALVALAASILLVPVTVEVTTGLGLLESLRPSVIAESIGQPGVAALVRIVALAALLVTRARGRRRLAVPVALVALGSFLVDGHTRTQDPEWVMWLGDAIHVLAAAIWLGGLVVLAGVLGRERNATDPAKAAADVGSFSKVAAWSLGGVLVAGSAMSWALVRQPRALTSTDYGVALLVKVVVVALVIAAALYNRRVLVPAVIRGHRGMAQLTRTVRFEAAGLAVAVAVTGGLVQLRPASDEAGITGAYQTSVEVADGLSMDIIVDPNRAGANEIHLYLVDISGRPHDDVEGVRLRLEQPERDIGPIERDDLIVAGPGHWQLIGRELSIPGAWEIQVIVALDRFDERAIVVPVVVNP